MSLKIKKLWLLHRDHEEISILYFVWDKCLAFPSDYGSSNKPSMATKKLQDAKGKEWQNN